MSFRKHRTTLAALLVLGLVLISLFFATKIPAILNIVGIRSKVGPTDPSVANLALAARPSPPVFSAPVTKASWLGHIQAALSSLRAAAGAEESRKILVNLHAYLKSLPPDVAASVITGFLADPAGDAPTKIEFTIGNNGSLSGQPTLRIALLDWLGGIDPQRAGIVAQQILDTRTSADEWAVCLRNYARAYPGIESNGFLRTKTEELIRNPNWRINPSVGFFESFDVLVHTRATQSTGLLAGMVADRTPEGKALAHASFLTLDRLTIHEPAAMIQQLVARPDLAKARPEMVANIIARADLRDVAQQQLVRSYLLDPARTAIELSAFAGVYPNANFAISNNLLTENTTLTNAEITARDTAALAVVETWLADPAFESVKPHLTAICRRLANFANPSEMAR